ncbi:MAG: hypothetical protein KDD66_02100 [Bdellovibrionales bacterium]|nr:hypothetical protein [Bdellovibrionales bacterium]
MKSFLEVITVKVSLTLYAFFCVALLHGEVLAQDLDEAELVDEIIELLDLDSIQREAAHSECNTQGTCNYRYINVVTGEDGSATAPCLGESFPGCTCPDLATACQLSSCDGPVGNLQLTNVPTCKRRGIPDADPQTGLGGAVH